jgi:hypothetical protein
MDKSLSLSEKLYVLGIHPEKGGIIYTAASSMNYVLPGAILLELFMHGNIVFDKKQITVKNGKAENELHHLLLEKLNRQKKPLKISRWLNKFSYSQKKIRKQLQANLTRKGIIRVEEKSFLFFRWKKPVLTKKQVVYHLQGEIENQIFKDEADENEILLLSMIQPAGLMKRIFPDKQKRKKARQHLKKMTVENQVSDAVAEAIKAVQAVAVSVAATSAASTAATSG